jgi:hypothetical protein
MIAVRILPVDNGGKRARNRASLREGGRRTGEIQPFHEKEREESWLFIRY